MYFAVDGGVYGRNLMKCADTDTWSPVTYNQGTARPRTRAVGELFFKTDATAGQNLYMCASTNTWTQQLNTGSGVNQFPGCSFDGGGATIAVNSVCTPGCGPAAR